jgi:hypothetical protein
MLYPYCCANYAANENYHQALIGHGHGAGAAAIAGLLTAPVPANLAQWTATATLFRDVACLPFGCCDLNVSS